MPTIFRDRSFQAKLKEYGIRIRKDFVDEKMSLMNEKVEGHITQHQVSLGWFIFRVDVLNIRGRAKEWGTPIGSGHFGHVMTGYTYRRRVYAIKRYSLDTPLDL